MYRSRWHGFVSVFWWFSGISLALGALQLVGKALSVSPGSLDRVEIQTLVRSLANAPAMMALGFYYWRKRLIPPPTYVRGARGLAWEFLEFLLILTAVLAFEIAVGAVGYLLAGFIIRPERLLLAGALLVIGGFAVVGARFSHRKRLVA